jgi:deoxyadenosine/deoxycytidine kinase
MSSLLSSSPISGTKPILISIDGLIGSGKTYLLNQLKKEYPEWHFIDEPLDTWTALKNEKGESLLEVFYKDKMRWSYTFQNCAVLSRYRNIKKSIDDWRFECISNPDVRRHNIFVTERCIETDFNVFAQMLHDDGYLDGIEWDLYKQWYRMLHDQANVNGIVYVNTPADISMERIHLRARKGEDIIPMDYLENLDKYHKKWINNTSTQFLIYNNYDIDENNKNTCSDVAKFINKLR